MTTFERTMAETTEKHWGDILQYAKRDWPNSTREQLDEALAGAKGQFQTGAKSGAYAALRWCANLMQRMERREIAPKTAADMLIAAADSLGFGQPQATREIGEEADG